MTKENPTFPSESWRSLPSAATAPEEVEGTGTAAGGASTGPSRRHSTRNYELDKTISHTTTPTVSIRRLSVAVVVDDHRLLDDEGKVTRQPFTPEELNRIEMLVKDAVGYDVRRGDSVNVSNVSFTLPDPPEPLPEPPLWEQQWVWDLAKQALGVLMVLFLLLGVFRPAMRRLTTHEMVVREQEMARLEAPGKGGRAGEGAAGELDEDQVSISGGGAGTAQLMDSSKHEQRVNTAGAVVAEDPRRVAQVVRNWMDKDE